MNMNDYEYLLHQTAALVVVGTFIGAMGLPALVIYPLHYIAGRAKGQEAATEEDAKPQSIVPEHKVCFPVQTNVR